MDIKEFLQVPCSSTRETFQICKGDLQAIEKIFESQSLKIAIYVQNGSLHPLNVAKLLQMGDIGQSRLSFVRTF